MYIGFKNLHLGISQNNIIKFNIIEKLLFLNISKYSFKKESFLFTIRVVNLWNIKFN
jgi:hypothetical protein